MLVYDLVEQISPGRIERLNQIGLSPTRTALQLLLSLDSILHPVEYFVIDETSEIVSPGEAAGFRVLVLEYAPDDVVGGTNIDGSVGLVSHHIDGVLAAHTERSSLEDRHHASS